MFDDWYMECRDDSFKFFGSTANSAFKNDEFGRVDVIH